MLLNYWVKFWTNSIKMSETIARYDSHLFVLHTPISWQLQSSDFSKKISILSSQLHFRKRQLMPEYSGLNIDPFGDIFVCPRMKTHGYCERHSPRPGKQTITPRVALLQTEHHVILPIYIMYYKKYNYRMYQTCNKIGYIYSILWVL